MECPYCKKEVSEGKIAATNGNVFWSPEGRTGMMFSEMDDGVVMLTRSVFIVSEGATAYCCRDCGMIFAPIPEKQETTREKLKKKWDDISEKREAAAEARQARAEEEKREKEREKRAKKDPWER